VKVHVFRAEAAAEYAEAKAYYTDIRPELGQRFEAEMEELIQTVCQDPQRYRQHDPPLRRHFGRTFPYAVIYLEEADRIVIFAVMHMRRRPGYWKSRVDAPPS
jgi:plasmid stabilization system protein ParE